MHDEFDSSSVFRPARASVDIKWSSEANVAIADIHLLGFIGHLSCHLTFVIAFSISAFSRNVDVIITGWDMEEINLSEGFSLSCHLLNVETSQLPRRYKTRQNSLSNEVSPAIRGIFIRRARIVFFRDNVPGFDVPFENIQRRKPTGATRYISAAPAA